MMGGEHEIAAVLQEHDGIIGATDLAGALYDRLQRRTDVGRRRGDHLQDVAAAGLIDQRLLKIAGLGLHLVEQACIPDRDHRLVGKGLQKLDVVTCEPPRLCPCYSDNSNRLMIAQHRNV
jgi:hypothetical protein